MDVPNANGDEVAPFAAVLLLNPVPNPLEVVPVAVLPNPVEAGAGLVVAPNENVPAGFAAVVVELLVLNENPVEAGFAAGCAPNILVLAGAGAEAAGTVLAVEPNANPLDGFVCAGAGTAGVAPKGEGAGAEAVDPNPVDAGVVPNGEALAVVLVFEVAGAVGWVIVEGAPNAKGDGLAGAAGAEVGAPNGEGAAAAGAGVALKVGALNGEGAGALEVVFVLAGVEADGGNSDGVVILGAVAADAGVAEKSGLAGSSFFGAPNEKIFEAGAGVVAAAGSVCLGVGVKPKGDNLPLEGGAGAIDVTEEPGVGAVTLISGAEGAGVEGVGVDTAGVREMEGTVARAGAGLGGALAAASAALRSLNILSA